MSLLVIFLIAISLSMDAFSLALSIGVASFPIKKCFLLSLVVGIFHFFMPIYGSLIGNTFIDRLNINTNFLSGVIFVYIAVQMFREYLSDEEICFNLKFLNILIFAFGVSLDSFAVGFTMDIKIIAPVIFSLFSFFFTFLGLLIGKFMNKIMGSVAILLGVTIMTVLSIINFVNFWYFN